MSRITVADTLEELDIAISKTEAMIDRRVAVPVGDTHLIAQMFLNQVVVLRALKEVLQTVTSGRA